MNRLGLSIAALFVLVLLVYTPVWLSESDTPGKVPEMVH